MDTNAAIDLVQGLIKNCTDAVTANQAEIDGLTVVLNILQGTLATQLQSITPEQLAAIDPTVVAAAQTSVAPLDTLDTND